jgi:hypothetical protein
VDRIAKSPWVTLDALLLRVRPLESNANEGLVTREENSDILTIERRVKEPLALKVVKNSLHNSEVPLPGSLRDTSRISQDPQNLVIP